MTTSDLWRSWPHRPTSRTVHLLNQHLRAASLWHSNIGHKLSTSLHWLQLQVGCLVSPLSLPYSTWAHLTPLCWTKCFWESICRYDVDMLRILYASLPLQRVGNTSIMEFLLPHMSSPSIWPLSIMPVSPKHDLSIGYHLYGQTFYQH